MDGLVPPCSPVLGSLIATGWRIRGACCRCRSRTTASAGSIWRPALLARGRARQLDLVELLTSLVTELASAGGPRCAVATKVELSVTMARSSFGWRWRRRQDGDGVVVLAMALVPSWRWWSPRDGGLISKCPRPGELQAPGPTGDGDLAIIRSK